MARQSAFDLQHATQALPWQHLPGPQSESAQHVLAERHEPLQQCAPVPHWPSVVQAQVPHWAVVGSQHWFARQAAFDRHPAAQKLFLQMGSAAVQSPLLQQVPFTHADPQHFAPPPHCASLVQGQLVEHSFVAMLQHWSARQSPEERHPATHPLFLQIGVPLSPSQSEFAQQAPMTHVPPQHFWSAPHSASLVQVQFCVPHCCVTMLQHWFARQSEFEWQQAVHEPLVQQAVDGQSESVQQAVVVHEPPQHFSPPGHCASVLHPQFCVPHVFVVGSQHSLARQSEFVQQFPGTHSKRTAVELSRAGPASALAALSACTTLPSGPPTVPSVCPPSIPGALPPPLRPEEHRTITDPATKSAKR